MALLLAMALGAGQPDLCAAGADVFGLKWSHMSLGDVWDRATAEVADFDGDGGADALVPGCSGGCWVVLSRSGSGYRQLATSLPGPTIDLFRLAPLPEGGAAVLATRQDRLDVTTWTSAALSTRTLFLDTEFPQDLGIIDLDGSGTLELVVVDVMDLFVYDFESGALQFTLLGFGGTDLDFGQLDADAATEVAIANGTGACWVVDGASLLPDWGRPSGFGVRVEFGDLTGDTFQELLTAISLSWNNWVIRAWDPPASSPLWESSPVPVEALVLEVAEIDPSPGSEVVIAGAGSSSLTLLAGVSGQTLRSYPFPNRSAVGVGDTDLDGEQELVLTGDYSNIYFRTVEFVDAASGSLEHRTPNYWMQSRGLSAADLDGDGDIELVAGAWNDVSAPGSYANAMIFAGIDGNGPILERLSETPHYGGMIAQLRTADIDGDSDLEVCATYSVGQAFVGCYTGAGMVPIWSLQVALSTSEMILAEIAGGTTPELVVERHRPYEESYVAVFQADTGASIWESANLSPGTFDVDLLCVGEVDALPGVDLVAGNSVDGQVSFLDPVDGTITGAVDSPASGGLECGDLDGNGMLELVASDELGTIGTVDPATGSWSATIGTLSERAWAIAVGDLLGDESPEIAALLTGEIEVLDSTSGLEVWSTDVSQPLDWYSGSLEIFDADGDGLPDLVSASQLGIAVFGRPHSGSVLFVDGFESGDAIFWSRARY